MKDEEMRLKSWKENILEAARSLEEDKTYNCAFKLGFTLQGIMIAIAEFEREMEED